MTQYPNLTHIDVAMLTGHAGGDPWAVAQILRDGDPGELAQLSRAFCNAGVCTSETVDEFDAAQARFRTAWNHQNGDHPINDSAEVRRAVSSLMFQRDQLPVVAAKLARIAAGLAQAQQSSSQWLDSLNTALHRIDAVIGWALAHRRNVGALEDQAIAETVITLSMIRGFRDTYSADLHSALTQLRVDSHYDPAIDDADADPDGDRRPRDAIEYYDAFQRAEDDHLVNSSGPMTPDKADAAARLRDFAVARDPGADVRSRELAGARLDDFRMAGFSGPLPIDPLLGLDARDRATTRLQMQRALEQGSIGLPAMSFDDATNCLNEGDHFSRVLAADTAVRRFTGAGMSHDGAVTAVDLLAQGTPLSELLDSGGTYLGAAETGVKAYARSFTRGDVETLKKIRTQLRFGGAAIDGITGWHDLATGQAGPGEVVGRVAGGSALGLGAEYVSAMALGSCAGPGGAALAAGIAGIAYWAFDDQASDAGAWVGRKVDELVGLAPRQ